MPQAAADPDRAAPDRRALAAYLEREGIAGDADALADIIAGLAAAPPAHHPEAALRLAVDGGNDALDAFLLEQRAALETAYRAAVSGGGDAAGRLASLRAALDKRGLDGFVVPLTDEHHNEYVALRAQRLAWLTGFTGSAGLAAVLREKAAIFIDGRYTLQVRDQVSEALYAIRHMIDEPVEDWLAETLSAGDKVGYDPLLHTTGAVKKLRTACEKAGAELVACADNPIDAVWTDQPPPPISPIVPHDERYAGKSSAAKRDEIAAGLKEAGADTVVIGAPDSIAWLLNVRGGDVENTPLPLSFVLLHADGGIDWFVDPRKLVAAVRKHVGNTVTMHSPEELEESLVALGRDKRTVQLDETTIGAWFFDVLKQAGATVKTAADPCALPKACKNPVEQDGARAAHGRDGAALTRFLAWLSAQGEQGDLTEISAADKLEEFRSENDLFRGLSFPTISGAGANGAIVHYRVDTASNRKIEAPMLYLVDSGAQYLDGTTDVTRTIAIGTPTDEQRDRFTRVLKGHIALARARFPQGTKGTQLDVLARLPLWEAGLDFDHGTGHGVGSYLSVHEGPQRISKAPNATALQPGMIVSNEPGYYKTGEYGIRIENLVMVREDGQTESGKPLLCFETLTLAPIDRTLIDIALLTAEERAWVDAYHKRVHDALIERVDGTTGEWLTAATRPLESA